MCHFQYVWKISTFSFNPHNLRSADEGSDDVMMRRSDDRYWGAKKKKNSGKSKCYLTGISVQPSVVIETYTMWYHDRQVLLGMKLLNKYMVLLIQQSVIMHSRNRRNVWPMNTLIRFIYDVYVFNMSINILYNNLM